LAHQRSTLEEFFTRTWSQRGTAARLLQPVACLFGALTALRRRLYRDNLLKTHKLPVPVIVVGNIYVGGTGKTPLVIWLVQALRQAGFKPGVISRGYGVNNDVPRLVTVESHARDVGDEPLLIAHRTGCPVMVGRDRVAVANALLQAHAEIDVLIADDGLQHYRLRRDIEIVLFDTRGIGNQTAGRNSHAFVRLVCGATGAGQFAARSCADPRVEIVCSDGHRLFPSAYRGRCRHRQSNAVFQYAARLRD
jgi:tetraacyldisaccharide 4'-kinase